MVHYRMSEPDPSAVILTQNPRTGSYEETKVYGGYNQKEIYLQDKQNFAIRFFNPMQDKIGARISFNGIVSNEYLVLSPGEDVILERFLGEQKKMIFDTYVVDAKNPQAMKAIENNGLIEISFYKEKKPIPYKWCQTTWSNSRGFGGGGTTTSGSIGGGNINQNLKPTGMGNIPFSKDYWFPSTDENVPLTAPFMDYSDDVLYDSNYLSEKIETGRVEKGGISGQNLTYTNVEFEFFPFLNLTFKLLPQTQERQYTTNTQQSVRNYCPNCSYRLRNDNWLFCPKCGSQI